MYKNIVDILLIEDNDNDSELTIRTLKKHHIANSIYVVKDGEEAINYLYGKGSFSGIKIQLPKVILLDIKLPKINGMEVLKTIKQDEKLKGIPVVMLTSSSQDPDIKTAYALGANSYVVKPVNIDNFTATINNLGMYWLVVNQPPKLD